MVLCIPSPFMPPSLWPRWSSACEALFYSLRRTYADTGYVGGLVIPWNTLAPNDLHVKPWPWARLVHQADARICAPARWSPCVVQGMQRVEKPVDKESSGYRF